MKKTVLLLLLGVAALALAQQTGSTDNPNPPVPDGTQPTNVSFPIVRITSPNDVDLACAGFVSKQLLPNANYVVGGLETPNTTQFGNGEAIYLTGKGYQLGQEYEIVRELRDQNRYELFNGQFALLNQMGQPYAELGRVRVIDVRGKSAIAQVEFSCDPIVPGDFAVKYEKKELPPLHPPFRFDRFLQTSGKTSGRIVLAKDFDGELGTGSKVYMNLGSNQGVKAGEYFRAFRPYEDDLQNPVDSLSFKASMTEDTQRKPAAIEANWLNKTGGPVIHVRDLPRRAVGEVLVLSTTPTTSTGMIVFALEDIHAGDGVELDMN